jgi:hypothetical protein
MPALYDSTCLWQPLSFIQYQHLWIAEGPERFGRGQGRRGQETGLIDFDIEVEESGILASQDVLDEGGLPNLSGAKNENHLAAGKCLLKIDF